MKMKEYYEQISLLKFKELEDEHDYMVAIGDFLTELSNIADHCERNKSQINKEQNKQYKPSYQQVTSQSLNTSAC